MAKNYKPVLPQVKTNHCLTGKRIIHRHRQNEHLPEDYRNGYKGTVVGVYDGINGGISVLFDNGNIVCLPCSDLALLETYPEINSPITSEIVNKGWL